MVFLRSTPWTVTAPGYRCTASSSDSAELHKHTQTIIPLACTIRSTLAQSIALMSLHSALVIHWMAKSMWTPNYHTHIQFFLKSKQDAHNLVRVFFLSFFCGVTISQSVPASRITDGLHEDTRQSWWRSRVSWTDPWSQPQRTHLGWTELENSCRTWPKPRSKIYYEAFPGEWSLLKQDKIWNRMLIKYI